MAKKENIESWTADDFRPHLGEVITDLREGNLFTACGLTESDNILEDDESPPSRSHKGHPFNILLEYVAMKLVKENGWEKKMKKVIYKQLCRFNEEWADEIRRYPPTGSVAAVETPNSKSLETPNSKEALPHSINHHHRQQQQHPSNDTKIEDKELGDEVPLKKPSAKKKVVSTTHQGPKTRDFELSDKERYQREVFERERDEILKEIPDEVKSRFGQIMFSKWSNSHLPVLVMSPFQVPPGGVRDMWYTMYEKVKSANRLNNMTNLIYWYGAYQDQSNAYSFVAQSKLIPFDVGCSKGYDQPPKPAPKKKANGQLLRGLEEMREDLEKKPEERSGRMGLDFLEVYQLPSESEDDEMEEQPIMLQKKRGRKKKSDLMKKAEEAAKEQATASMATKKHKKKPGRKRKHPLPEEMEEPPAETMKKKMKLEQNEMEVDQEQIDVSTPIASRHPVKEEYADEGLMPHDDKNGEDVDDFETESDEADDDYDDDADENPKAKPGPKPKKKKPGPKPKKKEEIAAAKQSPKKRGKPGPKPKKKKKDDTKSESSEKAETTKKAPSLATLKRKEQEKFAECEQMFLPIIQRWETALEDKNTSALEELYEDICALVGQFSAPFIEEYDLYPLIKVSKKVHDGPNRKKLYVALKEAYTQKKDEVPEGFKPKKSKPEKKRNPEKAAQQEAKRDAKKPKIEGKTESSGTNERSDKTTFAKVSKDKEDTVESTERGPSDVKEKNATKDVPPPDETSPPTIPIKRTGSMENVSVPEDSLGGSLQKKETPVQKKETPVKVERKKKFSLGSLMRPTSSAPKLAAKNIPIKQSSSTGQLIQQKRFPVWISQPPADTPGDDPNRSYALSFFRQAAPFIPQSKHVNHDAIAVALESAVFGWAGAGSGGPNWLVQYWEKVHEIVASISGKRKKSGTIASLIAEGRFKSADEIVRLPEDVYIDSFEGRSVTI